MDLPNQENAKSEWFENLIDQYDYQSPKPGQLINGDIISIDDDGILVDIGLKRDALIPSKDLSQLDSSIISSLEIGENVSVYVLGKAEGDRELLVSLSKGIEYASWKKAEELLNEGSTINLEIVGHNRGGLIVKFDNLRGFLPYSLVPEIQNVRNPKRAERIKNDLIGNNIEVKVIEVAQHRNRLIFSAMAAQEEKRRQRLENLKKGEIITGNVASIVDFGVFVDLDGIDGLVHISQLDWKKVKHPSEIVKLGDEINVQVISVDIEKQRVSLSRKTVLPSPWDSIGETLKPGDYIEGKVTRLVEFGAFVRLPSGVEGLIHISQVGYSSSQDPQNAIRPRETVLLRVLDVDPERKRIALSMRQVPLEKQIAWAMEHVHPESSNNVNTDADDNLEETDLPIDVQSDNANTDTDGNLEETSLPIDIQEEDEIGSEDHQNKNPEI
jgi:small subunit ribosomal protein S1